MVGARQCLSAWPADRGVFNSARSPLTWSLIAVNDRGFQDLLKDKFKIGADAAASAGPVGRNGQAATDWKMNAELLTYSRSKGLFAGIDLDGTSVSQNQDDTTTYFGHEDRFEEISRAR